MLRRTGAVLLERRPAPGIWGGLWCFPGADAGQRAGAAPRRLEPIEHGFTHFRLRIQPLLCQERARRTPISGRWLTLDEAQRGGAAGAGQKSATRAGWESPRKAAVVSDSGSAAAV